jgi:hypothetical protein
VLYDVQARTSKSGYLASSFADIKPVSGDSRNFLANTPRIGRGGRAIKKKLDLSVLVASPVFMHLRNCAAPEWIGGERRRY